MAAVLVSVRFVELVRRSGLWCCERAYGTGGARRGSVRPEPGRSWGSGTPPPAGSFRAEWDRVARPSRPHSAQKLGWLAAPALGDASPQVSEAGSGVSPACFHIGLRTPGVRGACPRPSTRRPLHQRSETFRGRFSVSV